MVNVVVLMGRLLDVDESNKNVRLLEVIEDYKNSSGSLSRDIIKIINWNKTNKGELFSLNFESLVMIKGRLEIIENELFVICETITYLGKNV